jgi:hypothetical protein
MCSSIFETLTYTYITRLFFSILWKHLRKARKEPAICNQLCWSVRYDSWKRYVTADAMTRSFIIFFSKSSHLFIVRGELNPHSEYILPSNNLNFLEYKYKNSFLQICSYVLQLTDKKLKEWWSSSSIDGECNKPIHSSNDILGNVYWHVKLWRSWP